MVGIDLLIVSVLLPFQDCTSGTLPAAIRVNSLQLTDQYWDLLDSIKRMVDYINDHGGFTVVG